MERGTHTQTHTVLCRHPEEANEPVLLCKPLRFFVRHRIHFRILLEITLVAKEQSWHWRTVCQMYFRIYVRFPLHTRGEHETGEERRGEERRGEERRGEERIEKG
jgi:hypothetical protein